MIKVANTKKEDDGRSRVDGKSTQCCSFIVLTTLRVLSKTIHRCFMCFSLSLAIQPQCTDMVQPTSYTLIHKTIYHSITMHMHKPPTSLSKPPGLIGSIDPNP